MRLDTHVHSRASEDGSMSIAAIAHRAYCRGLTAVAVCDHNTTAAFAELERINSMGGDVLLIRGCEFSTEIGHVIGLFVPSDIEHTILKGITGCYDSADVLCAVKKAGGLCIWAHPCKGSGADRVRELAPRFDLVEGYNGRSAVTRKGDLNAAFRREIGELDVRLLAASDSHRCAELGSTYTEFDCPTPLGGWTEQAVRELLLHTRGQMNGSPSWPWHEGISQLQKALRGRSIYGAAKALAKIGWSVWARLRFCPTSEANKSHGGKK